MSRTRAVVGLGNPFRRDDGVAPVVLERLRDRPVADEVAVFDLGDAGFRLLHVLAEFDVVVVVDAVRFGGDPGEHVVARPDELASLGEREGTHDTAVLDLVETSDRLEEAPADVLVFGVQPARTGYGEGLSDPVESAVPALVDALAERLSPPE
ncbi:MAG: hydrogenase maturation protease [Haloarculaceae archaeon]